MLKKVLYIGGFELPDKNAAAQRVLANAKLLKEIGFDVSFIGISKDITNAPKDVNGFKSNPVPYPKNIKEWIHQILIFVNSKKILEYAPDYVILYNFPSIASLRILRACHKKGIKVFHDLTEWECNNRWRPSDIIRKLDINLRMRYCIKKMDGVIAISRYLYEYYKEYTNTIMVPPTVDLNNPKFCRKRALSASDGKLKLIYAGSVGPAATKDRLDIIIRIVNSLSGVQLDIVGLTEEQYNSVFGNKISIGKNIVFHGRVSHTEAVKLVCDADFQLLIRENTLKNKAGFPTKFVESLSCCTPVIATISSNICDYLQDGVNGFIVTKEQPLEEVIKKAKVLSVEEKVHMKEACRNFEGFDYSNYKKEFSKLFV